jgi:hypothetical protein
MANVATLPESKKLSVTYRVEPGCLGPEGKNHVSKFCLFAQSELKSLDAGFIIWNIVPKLDKSLPEMECHVFGKKMTQAQADKYLAIFGKGLEEFEEHLINELTLLINTYMGH